MKVVPGAQNGPKKWKSFRAAVLWANNTELQYSVLTMERWNTMRTTAGNIGKRNRSALVIKSSRRHSAALARGPPLYPVHLYRKPNSPSPPIDLLQVGGVHRPEPTRLSGAPRSPAPPTDPAEHASAIPPARRNTQKCVPLRRYPSLLFRRILFVLLIRNSAGLRRTQLCCNNFTIVR